MEKVDGRIIIIKFNRLNDDECNNLNNLQERKVQNKLIRRRKE